MNEKKQLAINMIAQIISFGVNLIVSFFFTPYIVNHVGGEAYGFVGLANNFISYVTVITTALNSMASRFITICIHQNRKEDTNKYFSSVFIANIVISIPITIIGIMVVIFIDKIVNVPSDILMDVRILWALLFVNFIMTLIGNVFNVATFARNRLELSSLRTIESNILRVIILVIAFGFFAPSVWYLGLSAVICGIYILIVNIYYTNKLLSDIKIKREYFDFGKIKELISSGLWNSITNISSMLSTGLDLLLSNVYIGATAMGIVSISKTLPTNILMVFAMLANVFTPQLTIYYAKNKFKEIKEQLITSMKLLGFIACIPMAFLYMYGKEFYQLWVPTQDALLLQILSIIGCAEFAIVLPLEAMWCVFAVTNNVKKSSLYMLINSVLSIAITIVLLQFAHTDIEKMIIVVGVSAVFSVIRGGIFLPIYGARCLKFKWNSFYPTIFKNLLATITSTALAGIIKRIIVINSWSRLFVDLIILCLGVCIINYFVVLGKKERVYIKLLMKKYRLIR